MSNKARTWLTIVKLLEYWHDSWTGRSIYTFSLQIRSLTLEFIIIIIIISESKQISFGWKLRAEMASCLLHKKFSMRKRNNYRLAQIKINSQIQTWLISKCNST